MNNFAITKEQLKNRIKVVQKEIKKEQNNNKKQRLNKYKQKLEIQLRDFNLNMK